MIDGPVSRFPRTMWTQRSLSEKLADEPGSMSYELFSEVITEIHGIDQNESFGRVVRPVSRFPTSTVMNNYDLFLTRIPRL